MSLINSKISQTKEDNDDIKSYEKRYLINGLYFSGESYKIQSYYETILISTSSVEFQHFSAYNINENIISIEDWGISTMKERQISLNKIVMSFTY
ncbi:hypothetical protein H5410_031272 [Solanum commersonii]|uniref:Uncharacterized protein n=1 Tax=Solanum commersonii TaxID=4109 RepID=A0A9J5YLT3_SOLCO|nr:hypothetical protein H5410_031272 [Solanum commersonii]